MDYIDFAKVQNIFQITIISIYIFYSSFATST